VATGKRGQIGKKARRAAKMTRYQLAKLVEWAGSLHSRKRLQKVVFLLQASGCPFDADYTLHHYGPYSQEVARLSDEMVQVGLLDESSEPNQVGMQYSYALSQVAATEMVQLEKSPKGKKLEKPLSPFEARAKELLNTDLKLLEVASTMVFFRKQGHSWPESVEKTCKFKNLTENSWVVTKAEGLAHQFVT
jgi:uncharacterized protein YwgA